MTLTLTEQAPSFDLPGIDGRNHALDDYGEAEVLVLIQSCNHCPYVQAWEQRIVAIQREYGERGVRIVAITASTSTTSTIKTSRSQALSAPSARLRYSFSTGSASSSTTAQSTTAATRRWSTSAICAMRSTPCSKGGGRR